MSRLILISSLLICLSACSSKSSPSEGHSAVAQTAALPPLVLPSDSLVNVQLPSDTQQSYYIYVPSSAHDAKSTPLIIFFDPHGSGRLPVEKYQKLADKFGMVLAGSNNSRNGMGINESSQIADNIISDLSLRAGYDTRLMCLTGFSGGAKVALSSGANNSHINNIIYSGASIPLNPTHPVHLLGFAGTEDMNYTDLLGFSDIINRSNPEANSLVEFKGKHDWPDTATFRKAFFWLDLQLYKQHILPPDSILVQLFQKETDKTIATLEKQNAMTEAYLESRNASSFLNGVADVSAYKTKMNSIASGSAYKTQMQQKIETIRKESSEKQKLMAAFQNEDAGWWYKTIRSYKTSAAASDKRLLGFVSLACYSYSGQLLTRNDTANAARLLSIYELDDPDNTDQLYFQAILCSQENKPEQGIKYLYKAVDKGFKDWQKIESEPAFTPWRGYESFSRLLASLKRGSK